MSSNSVFPDDHEPTLDELKALGREALNRLWLEAARRLDRQRRVYGPDYRPGRQHFLEWSLRLDLEKIDGALQALQDDEARQIGAGDRTADNAIAAAPIHLLENLASDTQRPPLTDP